ncbi:MAG: dTDP-4-dehydrorhamnose 3,5-epimerase family protein [Actinomycetes bacterium]
MDVRELKVPDAFEFTPRQHPDDRGVFLEYFKSGPLVEAIGHPLRLEQANCSVSSRGTLRGIHFAQVPPSQAKYVTCVTGAGLDVVVDIRVGSPTYGQWDAVVLDETDRRAVYVAEGLGHAFLATSDNATLMYLCSEGYNPGREHGVNPLDPAIGIEWPSEVTPLLSPKDAAAPTLAQAEQQGLLPTFAACQAFYARLRAQSAPA